MATTDHSEAPLHNDTNPFYDSIADKYHLFYRDWEAVIQRESSVLRRTLRGSGYQRILDASCGTGTQTIPLAQLGYQVTAADPSEQMLAKAHEMAAEHKLVADNITFIKADFLSLPQHVNGPFDAVITKGNALPHLLTDNELLQALRNFYDLLRPGGLVLVGMRDYDFMLEDRPRFIPRQVHLDNAEQEHILFDIWDWDDGPPVVVTFNTFIVSGKGTAYTAHKHVVKYRALRREELDTLMTQAGFVDLQFDTQVWELVAIGHKPE